MFMQNFTLEDQKSLCLRILPFKKLLKYFSKLMTSDFA